MKIKRIKQEKLREYIYTLPGAKYQAIFGVERSDGLVTIFSGPNWPKTPTVEVVVFDNISDFEIMKLQLVLSYGTILSKASYRRCLVRLFSVTPTLTSEEFAKSIMMSEAWVLDVLSMRKEFRTLPIGNAYCLSMLRDPKPLLEAAKTMEASEFVSAVMAQLEEEKAV